MLPLGFASEREIREFGCGTWKDAFPTMIVSTIPERCKRCYCCVRECPARAIQIEKGQAVVIGARCIGCGNCIKVCTQSAKQVDDGVEPVRQHLAAPVRGEKIALIAPSFPAAFPDVAPRRLVGAIVATGFTKVVEVGFGADLVSTKYRDYVEHAKGPVITTPCPAIVEFIEKYHPELIPSLAPIVSPMIAAGRVVRERYGTGSYVAFIGPCVAKKLEALDPEVEGVIDAVLTFDELELLFERTGVDPAYETERDCDQPHGHLGQIYPVSGGLLKSAGLSQDVMDEDVTVVEGRDRCLNIIDEIARGGVHTSLIDILFCEGCINGPGMHSALSFFEKRERIIQYVRQRTSEMNVSIWRNHMRNYAGIPMMRGFRETRIPERTPDERAIEAVLAETGKAATADQLNCGACGYDTCRGLAEAVAQGLAEPEMCLPWLIERLERSHRELAEAQEQLIHSEKLASVGQLAAGVAHEINNPLGTILLYSHLLLKQVAESESVTEDLRFIIEETERCRTIVSNLLNFARQGKLSVAECSARELIENIVAMLGRREEFASISIVQRIDEGIPALYIDGEQMRQVLLNIAINACEAMPSGGTLTLAAHHDAMAGEIVFTIADTGTGIAREHLSKLFTPFFTTKQIGKGTGLGLPIAYGIVKMHRGQIQVRSTVGTGTAFRVSLPIDVRGHATAARTLLGDTAPSASACRFTTGDEERPVASGMGAGGGISSGVQA